MNVYTAVFKSLCLACINSPETKTRILSRKQKTDTYNKEAMKTLKNMLKNQMHVSEIKHR